MVQLAGRRSPWTARPAPFSYRDYMPYHQGMMQFLRDRARRLLEMAECRTELSDQLKVMAAELEARADELQRDQDRKVTTS